MSFLLLILSQFSWFFLIITSRLCNLNDPQSFKTRRVCEAGLEVSVIIAFRDDKLTQVQDLVENIANEIKCFKRAEILLVEDGCSYDKSSCFRNQIVRYFALPKWRGKSVAQNLAVSNAKYNPLLLLDADVGFEKGAIAELVHDFNCQNDGVVSGNLVFSEDEYANNPHSSSYLKYWSMERKCRKFLDDNGMLLTASGPCMLVNKRIWPEQGLPADFGDDCALPFYAAIKGFKVRMDTKGPSFFDLTYNSAEAESNARIRMSARNINATIPFLSQLTPIQILTVLLHRVGRWFSPMIFLIGLITAILEAVALKSLSGLSVFILIIALFLISSFIHRISIIRGFLLINVSFFRGTMLYFRGKVASQYSN